MWFVNQLLPLLPLFMFFFFSVLVASFNFQPLKRVDESTTCPIKTEGNPYVSLAAIFHCSMPVPHKLQRPSYRENTEDNSRQSLVRQSQRNTLDRRGRLTTLSQRVIIEMMWGFLFCFLDWHLDLRQPTNWRCWGKWFFHDFLFYFRTFYVQREDAFSIYCDQKLA